MAQIVHVERVIAARVQVLAAAPVRLAAAPVVVDRDLVAVRADHPPGFTVSRSVTTGSPPIHGSDVFTGGTERMTVIRVIAIDGLGVAREDRHPQDVADVLRCDLVVASGVEVELVAACPVGVAAIPSSNSKLSTAP